MKKIQKYILSAFVAFIICLSTNAQQVNTLYFLDNAPMKHYINPAFQPLSNVYISLPIIGYTSLWAGNSSLTLKDVIYKDATGQTISFMHPNGDKNQFFNRLNPRTAIDLETQLNILSVGWRWKEAYWHVTIDEKIEGVIGVPRDLFRFALYGMQDLNGVNTYDFKSLNANLSAYTELGLGYSHNINEKWTVGGKLKFLYGTANISVQMKNLQLTASPDEWTLNGEGQIRMAMPIENIPDNIGTASVEDIQPSSNWKDWVKPSGLGAAIDLGATYKPIEMLSLSFSVTDLGFIGWSKKNAHTVSATTQSKYDGLGEVDYENFTSEGLVDTLVNRLKNGLEYTIDNTQQKAYMPMIAPKLNIGAEVNFWDNRVGVGVHSRTKFAPKKVYEEITLGASLRPVNWFNLAASYSFFNGRFSSMGAALGLRGGPLNLTIMADYIPFTYVNYATDAGSNIPIPYNIKGLNVGIGLNLVFGNKQDKDKDGVKNRKDKCPDTPKGVIVDAVGCPVDTDKDGVPDYLDQCPDTPLEADSLVNEYGCPLDTDGDSVPDYLDQCPDTPEAAYGQVDEKGCPKDTDLDGVPDYLDECPDTPREAYGTIDEKGCPKDTDGDGVLDYLDLCPNTPEAAYGQVDEKGCPKDDDLDGIPNYLDKCLDTKAEAVKFVDENGCDKDSDADGVPDYLDNCPKTPGTIGNKGCPEVKKEVRNLFKKALQGIQFETGKDVIKKASYPILKQIAKVMIDNPTYLIEIQGHTDDVGDDKMNQTLSEKRANAVRNFLIKESVAETRLTAHGYGESMPVASNKTSKGRAQNRRVEFIVSFEEVTYETVYPNDTIKSNTPTEIIIPQ